MKFGTGSALNQRRALLARASVLAGVAIGTLAIAAAWSSSPNTPAGSVATVESTTLSRQASTVGTVAAAREQNLGFPRGGRLTSVLVKVGDHVEAGDPLATVDDGPARLMLAQLEAQLRAQKAALKQLKESASIDGAEDSLDQAEDVRDAVRSQVEPQRAAADAAVTNARNQLAADERAAAVAKSVQDSTCSASSSSSDCARTRSEYAAAQQRAASSRTALGVAIQQRDAGSAAGNVAVETAEQGVTAARTAADMAESDRPHLIDQQRAAVDAAEAAVAQARRDLDDTTLRAPTAGTVTVLNGAVGEYVAGSMGTSALAPGSDASLPGASGATSGGTASAMAAAMGGSSRPGGNQFLVLSDLGELQVVASYNESDATQLSPGQSVHVTFDAIPDLTAPGRIVSVAPSGTAVSGVISYYVTVSMDTDDDRIKPGQTANVIRGSEAPTRVLTVPSAAVHQVGGRSEVTVIEGGATRTVRIETGASRGGRTEVRSGLHAGQRVALRSAQEAGGAR